MFPLFSLVLKHNPFHDSRGRFSSQNSAIFVSTGDKFAKTLNRLKAEFKAKEAEAKKKLKSKPVKPINQTKMGIYDKGEELIAKTHDSYNRLSSVEKSLIYNYTGADSGSLNSVSGKMGSGQRVDEPALESKVFLLNQAIHKMEVPEDMAVFRSVSLGRMGGAFAGVQSTTSAEDLKKLVGQTYTEHSFASSSTSAKAAGRFLRTHRTFVQMEIPKGSKGAWVGGSNTRGAIASEQELLLPTNSTYIVTGSSTRKVKPAGQSTAKTFNVLHVKLVSQD